MSSKKRTDGRPRGTSPSKRRKSEGNDALAWTDSGVQVLLPGGERITITGTGTVAVHSGEIDVAGHRMSASSRPLHFSVDNSSPVVITAVAAEAQVPLAGSRGAVFSISHPPNSNTVSSASADLDVHLVGDPGNPHSFQELPESWRQGAGELCASVDAGLAAGAPPAVIAICGGKNVGKSSFARLLVSMLLNRHHTVAYLDTGETNGQASQIS